MSETLKEYRENNIQFINDDWEDQQKLNANIELWRKPYEGYFHKCVKFKGKLNSTDINRVMDMMNNPGIKKQISQNSVLPIDTIQKIKDINIDDTNVSLFYQENEFPWPYSKRFAYLVTFTQQISDDHYIYVEKTIDHKDDSINTNDNVLWIYTNTISYEKKDDHILTTMTCKFDLGETYIPVMIMDKVIERMAILYHEWNQLL